MALPGFLQQKGKNDDKNKKSKKGDFREKSLKLLEQIKTYNEAKYQELNKAFNNNFDSVNIQKKKILGFYAQLVAELKVLRTEAGEEVFKKVVKKVEKKVNVAKKKVEKKKKATKAKAKTAKKKKAKKKA
jgi:hypothetical protein